MFCYKQDNLAMIASPMKNKLERIGVSPMYFFKMFIEQVWQKADLCCSMLTNFVILFINENNSR